MIAEFEWRGPPIETLHISHARVAEMIGATPDELMELVRAGGLRPAVRRARDGSPLFDPRDVGKFLRERSLAHHKRIVTPK